MVKKKKSISNKGVHRPVRKHSKRKVTHRHTNIIEHQENNQNPTNNSRISEPQKNYSKFHNEKDIAIDFATKLQRKFDHLIKATVLFGSQVSGEAKPGSGSD